MAAFREHVTCSTLLGVVYGAGCSWLLSFSPVQGILAAALTGVAGMLPDLDSDSGRPVRELFGFVAAIAPLFLVRRVLGWLNLPADSENVLLSILLLYAGIRYGLKWLVGKLSVHRGMFHSIPAMFIAGQLTFLGYPSTLTTVKAMMAAAVGLGFLSHLVLDEIYSVQVRGVTVNLKKSSGTAVKMTGPTMIPNVFAYALWATLSYAVLDDAGLIVHPEQPQRPIPVRFAAPEETSVVR